jgi:TonB-linked SusC/RagA family outer membrane protein
MEKRQQCVASIRLAMRITIVQIALSIFFACSLYAKEANSQIVLQKTFSLSVEDMALSKIISQVQKQTKVVFSFSSNSIHGERRISYHARKKTILEFLNEVLLPGEVGYRVINEQVILFPLSETAANADKSEFRIYADRTNDKEITGKITDENNKPLSGVSVVEKGSTNGTTTGGGGTFTLNVSSGDAVLVISYTGYDTREVAVANQSELSIALTPNNKMMEDVVVVGYGTVKKNNLAGSVVSVTPEKYKAEPVTNFTQALQGRAAGVVVSNNSGAPGGNVKVRIRGASSLLGNNDPLYVVDGVILNIGIADININDVENFEVLKDAAATAIYGNRGANGVIIITTKRGKSGASNIQVEVNTGISKLARRYDLMDAATYAETVNYIKPDYFTPQQIAGFRASGGVDWQDEIFQTGVTQNYQLSTSGGSPGIRYFISANYINQTGILLRSEQKKYSVRSNISTDLGKKIKVDLNVFAARLDGLNNQENGYKGAPTWGAVIYSPTFQKFTPDNIYNRQDNLSSPNTLNPYMVLQERYGDYLSNSLTSNAKFSYKIAPNLSLDVVLGVDQNSYQSGGYVNKWLNPANTTANLSEAKSFYWQNSNILTYSKNFNNKHDLTITAVNEQSQNTYNSFSASGSGIDPISVTYNNLGIANGRNINSAWSQFSLRSYVGRVGYSFLNRYVISATYRADATSKFQGPNKWGYFPSIAAAWRVSEEAFLKDNALINSLKLRGSWGKTGNQGINPYATVSSIGTMMHTYGLGQPFPGSIIVGVDNKDLKWETTAQTNFGFDLSILNNRLGITADYFVKTTSDLLNRVTIPIYNGGGFVNKNIGKVENKGFDFIINGTPVSTKDLRWEASFNFTAIKNKVVNLGLDSFQLGGNYAPGLTQESPFAIKVGEPLGAFWGYEWQGVYTTAEATKAASYGFAPGDNKYLDWNNDGKIDSKDKHVIGYAQPKYTWGFNNTFTYKQLDLNVMLLAQQGNKMLNTAYASSATILADATSIVHKDGLNFWKPGNDIATFANPLSSSSKNFIESTQFLEDASFIKIKNVALGYAIDKRIVKIADLKLLLSVQNLHTFTKYKGYDPETSTSSVDADGAIDVGAYPSSRTFTISLRANF